LCEKGLTTKGGGRWALTQSGQAVANELRLLRPPIYYFYRDFYAAIEHSQAFDGYATQVFGKNLGQHGFSDLGEIHLMLDKLQLSGSAKVLDIGCGNGKIAEYISDLTQVLVTGVDYVPEAISQARERTVAKRSHLRFVLGNIENLDFTAETFDAVISIDSIFFGRDMEVTLRELSRLLKPLGKTAVFNGDYLLDRFTSAVAANSLACETYDISEGHYRHLQVKNRIAQELEDAFRVEGNTFIWENLMAESVASAEPYDPERCKARRYLHIVTKQQQRRV
jgi:ubiquinone/menaquinone biosynthesis C-methylase UbiE